MGCIPSRETDTQFLKVKARKKTIASLLEAASEWKFNWTQFIDTIEQNQLNAAHWTQDEDEYGEIEFSKTFKVLSLQSTELFILSRSFLDNQEEYIYVLTDLFSELRMLHYDIKSKLKMERELTKLYGANRVFPEDGDVCEFDPEMNVYFLKKRKLEKCLERIKELEEGLQTRISSMLFDTVKAVLFEQGKLWASFSNVFNSMFDLAAQLNGEWKKIGYISHQPKQKAQREARMKLLNKWIFCAKKCCVAWEQLRQTEGMNCLLLKSLVALFKTNDEEKTKEFEKTLRNWGFLVENQMGNSTMDIDSTIARSDLFKSLMKILQEQATLLSQISQRELSVKDYVKELETLQQDKTSQSGKEKTIKVDAAKHKLNTLITENRLFRLEQLRLFEQKAWSVLKDCSLELSKVYIRISDQSGSCVLLTARNSNAVRVEQSVSVNVTDSGHTSALEVHSNHQSSESILTPLVSAPKPPPYSESTKNSFPRASGVNKNSNGSAGKGIPNRRWSYTESVPSISVHVSEDDIYGRPVLPNPNPELLDPTRAGRQSLSASSPFLGMTPPPKPTAPSATSVRDLNPSKPPPPIPKNRKQSGRTTQGPSLFH